MKYLDLENNLGDAECSNDIIKSSELLEQRVIELDKELNILDASSPARLKPLLDSGYILLDLVGRKAEAWVRAEEALHLALAEQSWTQAVEACDVMYQSEEEGAIKALGHGIWLGVTYPIDPELSVAMLQHLIEETPDNSDGAGVAAAAAHYIVDLRAVDKQRDNLIFFTNQMMGQVARRHTNGACDTQDLFEIWMDRLELKDPDKFLPRLAQIVDVIVPSGEWWFSRDTLREQLPAE